MEHSKIIVKNKEKNKDGIIKSHLYYLKNLHKLLGLELLFKNFIA